MASARTRQLSLPFWEIAARDSNPLSQACRSRVRFALFDPKIAQDRNICPDDACVAKRFMITVRDARTQRMLKRLSRE